MSISSIIMMVIILGIFWGGFSVMVYRTITTRYEDL